MESTTPVNGTNSAADLARRPGVGTARLLQAIGCDVEENAAEWADIELKYAGYIAKEQRAAERLRAMEELALPEQLEYHGLNSLSFEAREKLAAARPVSIGQAARVPGVSPADLQGLIYEVVRRRGR